MNKFLRSPIATVVLFALAAVLLGFGGINAIQAAPRIESSDYRAQVQLSNINVAIVEGETTLDTGDALLSKLKSDPNFKIGVLYEDEKLAVKNTKRKSSDNDGESIEEYVRVTVYRYWTDSEGKKLPNLDPKYIELNWCVNDGWWIDNEASTDERTVLYYTGTVKPEETTPYFVDGITINSAVATADNYAYDKAQFHVKVTADAVQTHNGDLAMTSAWGRTNKQGE